MSTNWTSVRDIMRDLSMVQGCGVPANIGQTIGAYDRPPTPELSDEEDQHEFCSGDLKYPAPDLGLIKEMLNMVRDKGVSSDDDTSCDMYISKKSEVSEKPKKISPQNITNTKTKPNQRNVALTSILKNLSEAKPLKLMKPNDFVSPEVEESLDKVNGWLDDQNRMEARSKKRNVVLEASNMFKRKTVTSPKASVPIAETSQVQNTNNNYIPSKYADTLYNELKEKQKLKTMMQEDIWSKAERQMKEIEERRRLEALKASSDLESTSSQGVDRVKLPQHRHLLTGDCPVCTIMKKHNYNINIEEMTDFEDFTLNNGVSDTSALSKD